MKALTIWQPYASLVAVGAKLFETRGWRPPAAVEGTRIAIHAAKTDRHLGLLTTWPFSSLVANAQLEGILPEGLPLGAFVASAVVAEVVPIDPMAMDERFTTMERALGEYDYGRFAWRLDELHTLPASVPCRGAQGLWTVPPDLVPRLVP